MPSSEGMGGLVKCIARVHVRSQPVPGKNSIGSYNKGELALWLGHTVYVRPHRDEEEVTYVLVVTRHGMMGWCNGDYVGEAG